MRCPNCGFVSFDDLDDCKKCGYDLVAHRAGGRKKTGSWFSRLRSRKVEAAAAKVEAVATATAEKKQAPARSISPPLHAKKSGSDSAAANPVDLQAHDHQLEQMRDELRHTYQQAPVAERRAIRAKLDELDRERTGVRRRIEVMEREHKTREKRIRGQLEVERRAVEEERRKSEELRGEMEAKLRESESARQEAQRKLEEATQAQSSIQSELDTALKQQDEIEQDLTAARQAQTSMQEELNHARRRQAEVNGQSEQLAKQAAEVKRLEAERRLLFEAAQRLQEERERLELQRLAAEKDRILRSRRKAAETIAAPTPEPVAIQEPVATPELVATPEPVATPELPAAVPPPNRAAEIVERLSKPAARAEDLLELYGRPRERRVPSGKAKETPPLSQDREFESVEIEEGEVIVEYEDHEQDAYVPKGGFLFRGMAALIDIMLLTMVVGLFLGIGLFVTGVSGKGMLGAIGTLGLPFYIVFLMLSAAYFTYMHGVYGQTLGKRLLGLRVMTTHGGDLGFLTAFFRFVTTCFSAGLLGMGVFWIALDGNKQGWHDKLSRTVVVRL